MQSIKEAGERQSAILEVVGYALAFPIAKPRRFAVPRAACFLFTLGFERFFMLYLSLTARFCFVEGALSFGRKGFFH